MRFALISAIPATFLLIGSTQAQASALRGVEVGDIDARTAPCTDFFEFSNGKWRAENPIPPSMPRWSRRWAAGEASKDKLRDILEAAALAKDVRGSDEQLIRPHPPCPERS